MLCALVDDNVVVKIEDLDDINYKIAAHLYQAAIDISEMEPQPQVGWTFDGANLVSNGLSSMIITKLAMLQRFTVPERIAILTYVNSNPASVPAILMQNIMVATFVDLTRPDTQAGINYLVSFGLITSGRATAILTTPPTAIEIYKG